MVRTLAVSDLRPTGRPQHSEVRQIGVVENAAAGGDACARLCIPSFLNAGVRRRQEQCREAHEAVSNLQRRLSDAQSKRRRLCKW